jgi:hypothetical protein
MGTPHDDLYAACANYYHAANDFQPLDGHVRAVYDAAARILGGDVAPDNIATAHLNRLRAAYIDAHATFLVNGRAIRAFVAARDALNAALAGHKVT